MNHPWFSAVAQTQWQYKFFPVMLIYEHFETDQFVCRVGIVEESAIRELKERLYANKSALMAAFLERDKENTGKKHLSYKLSAIQLCST